MGNAAGAAAVAEASERGGTPSRVGYAPIVRVDAARREIELCATSEAVDAHGTVFDYEASKDAFTRWIGNVREMHERRAVGQRVEARCDDETRRVYVRVRISRGAQDTWEKVLDGTLRGASIGASNVVWRRERRGSGGRARAVNVATRYDLAELSLVDNPSNPDTLGVIIVRDAEPDLAMLDTIDPIDGADPAESETAGRASVQAGENATPAGEEAGQPDTAPTARDTLHGAARAVLAGCGCALCELALAALDPDDSAPTSLSEEERGSGMNASTRVTAAALRVSARELARLEAALRALMEGRLAERGAPADVTPEAVAEAEVAALKARVERLEAQPLPGGPAARAVEKTLAAVPLDGYSLPPTGAESLTALEALAGRLRDPQAQMAVAAEMIRLQQGTTRP